MSNAWEIRESNGALITHIPGGKFDGDAKETAELIARAPSLLADNERLREALRECDKAFASWQVGQIPGRPENILALISKVRSALSATERSK